MNEWFVLNMATLVSKLHYSSDYYGNMDFVTLIWKWGSKQKEDNLSCLLNGPTSVLTPTVHVQFPPI